MSLASTAMPSCLVPSKRSGFSHKSVGVRPLSVGTMPLSVRPVGTVPLNSKTVAQDGGLSPKRGGRLQVGKALFSCYGDDKPRNDKLRKDEPRKGVDIIVETLEREGIEHVFACRGEIHEALTRSKVIKNILCCHEEGEIFAAEGYARSTGKVGVCIATGATNLVSGLVDALRDSIPLVAITGQAPCRLITNNANQETPIVEVTRSITKHTYLIMYVEEIPRLIKEAFFLAASGRPGPVLVDIPQDVQQEMAIPNWTINSYLSPQIPQLEQILHLVFNSKMPILYVGGGCLNASQELRKFVDYTGIPVTTTLMGLGSFPSSDERNLGMPQMSGYANSAVGSADLLLAFGVRFDDGMLKEFASDVFASYVSIVHIDIDVQLALQGLNNLIKNREGRPDFQLWREKLKERKTEWWCREGRPIKYVKSEDAISPQHAIQLVYELTKGNAIIATGVGQHQMWAAKCFKYDRPRQWLTSEGLGAGLGAMGFGLPAALGAAVGNPGMTVVDIDEDGSFLMNVQELATIKEENLPVKIMILNNKRLGMVVQWQDRFYKANRAHTHLGDPSQETEIFPDFLKMAESCKIPAARVTNEADLKVAISKMLETSGPYLLDVIAPHYEEYCHTYWM